MSSVICIEDVMISLNRIKPYVKFIPNLLFCCDRILLIAPHKFIYQCLHCEMQSQCRVRLHYGFFIRTMRSRNENFSIDTLVRKLQSNLFWSSLKTFPNRSGIISETLLPAITLDIEYPSSINRVIPYWEFYKRTNPVIREITQT